MAHDSCYYISSTSVHATYVFMLMMYPSSTPRDFMERTASRAQILGPYTFTSKIRFHSSDLPSETNKTIHEGI